MVAVSEPVAVDPFAGRIHVEWDPAAALTPLGQLPFFTEFLKVSPNPPKKRDVLGTLVLAILAGHQRYAHISGLRGDAINPKLLGMSKVVSEDSVRASLAELTN